MFIGEPPRKSMQRLYNHQLMFFEGAVFGTGKYCEGRHRLFLIISLFFLVSSSYIKVLLEGNIYIK